MSHSQLTSPAPLRSALRHSRPPSPSGPAVLPHPSHSASLPVALQASSSSSGGGKLPRGYTGGGSNFSPPVGYTPKVSFNTFENPNDDALFSYTLQVKSEGYKRTRRTRVFLCASSPDESGSKALEWCIEELVSDDDELVVVRGFDVGDLGKSHDHLREEAQELMRFIQDKNVDLEDGGSKLSIVVELVAGKITDTIERMIALYRPDSLVVGTRGKTNLFESVGAALGAGVGSVSRYCMSHSPVPVIVVQPNRRRAKEKRRADPKRRSGYDQISQAARRPLTFPHVESLP